MSIRDTVVTIIAEELQVELGAISDSSSLVHDLGATSPQRLEMALAIEAVFGLHISDRDLAGLRTVGDVIAYVVGRKGG